MRAEIPRSFHTGTGRVALTLRLMGQVCEGTSRPSWWVADGGWGDCVPLKATSGEAAGGEVAGDGQGFCQAVGLWHRKWGGRGGGGGRWMDRGQGWRPTRERPQVLVPAWLAAAGAAFGKSSEEKIHPMCKHALALAGPGAGPAGKGGLGRPRPVCPHCHHACEARAASSC